MKIVGMSADDNAMEVFISAGADVFVPKPIKFQDLESIIKEGMNKKKNTMV